MRKLDLIGKVFGRITVIGFSHVYNTNSYWFCRRACGVEKLVQGSHLTSGKIVSCGCYARENISMVKKKKWSPVEINEATLGIPLTHGKIALIDKEDFDKIKNYGWGVDSIGYAYSTKNKKLIRMHRLILKCPKGMEIDHISRDKLDNRKSNLRAVTHRQNLINSKISIRNTSGFSGVSYNKRMNKYESYIRLNEKKTHIGFFTNIEEASKASSAAIKERSSLYFSEISTVNNFSQHS